MSVVDPTRPEADAITELRKLRGELLQLLSELRVWTDLLRHKAHALRSTSPRPLVPHELARDLAAARVPEQRSDSGPRPHVVRDDAEELLARAQAVWDTVADPRDQPGSRELADVADRLADRLETRWQDAREQLRASGERLVVALARTRREAEHHDC